MVGSMLTKALSHVSYLMHQIASEEGSSDPSAMEEQKEVLKTAIHNGA